MDSWVLSLISTGIFMIFVVSIKIYKMYLHSTENSRINQVLGHGRRVLTNQRVRRRTGSTLDLHPMDTIDIPRVENQSIFVDTVTGRIDTVPIVDPTPLIIAQEPNRPECPHCGRENNKTSLFCVYCGTEL